MNRTIAKTITISLHGTERAFEQTDKAVAKLVEVLSELYRDTDFAVSVENI